MQAGLTRRRPRRLACAAGLLASMLAPNSASAAIRHTSAVALTRSEQPDDPGPSQGELWRNAQTKLETADYEGAIVDLTTLYELVVQDPEAEALRNRVRLALHEAHVGAYGTDDDRDHLVAALDLLDRTLDSIPADGSDPQRAALTARREQVQALLDAHQAPEPISEIQPLPEPEPSPEVRPDPEPEPMPRSPIVHSQPAPTINKPLVIGGAVLVGLGAVGTALLIGGLVSANNAVTRFEEEPDQRTDARQNIERGNTLGIVGGVAGGVLTVSGAVLLGLGLNKRRTNIAPLLDTTNLGV